MSVRRIYVQKKKGFDIEAKEVLTDLKENLLINGLADVVILSRYDVSGISDEEFAQAKNTIFSEPQVDDCFEETYDFDKTDKVFGVEYLPGQFDQRATALSECLQIITGKEKPQAKSAKIYIFKGNISDEELEKIKKYLINAVDSRECSMEKPETLDDNLVMPEDVQVVEGFINMTDEDEKKFYEQYGFAMDLADLKFCQKYFRDVEKRDPTMTEMKMIDTYWSDHCRHTTFLTKIEVIDIKWDLLQHVYEEYLKSREYVYDDVGADLASAHEKDISLMDIATIVTKELNKKGLLKDLDKSEEINACSIKADILVDGKPEEYLIMFKNETHNHPTEIEPFGGAATCLGGAIRDPLSGRTYVYQAMRVTGCGDPRQSVQDTLPNKLPQRKLTNGASKGYSSYGNQIGLATGQVTEIYHPGYVAKRLEIGALIGAAPSRNVIRLEPVPGDKVILLGGRTGRDGIGGATGSSKAHDSKSLVTCGAEVQKGNAPEERKIQRLFRNPEASRLIKRCNDFGAGGVSVAIGELADGLVINLDKVPKKYEGLDGTELAISESQERMAVVVESKNVERFEELARKENIETTVVADVVENPRVQMYWRGKLIVDVSREFLNTNGDVKKTSVEVDKPDYANSFFNNKADEKDAVKTWEDTMQDLNCASQRGLTERFDGSIGANTVLMPLGGKYQLTPTEGMCARIPTLEGYTDTGTIMSFGYNPYLSSWSPFHGAIYAIIESITKYVAIGGDYKKAWFTLQEFFEKLRDVPSRWGKPFAALLGAYYAQKELGLAAIGGKDSMSGSYNELDVPPTLVSFCVGTVDITKVVSNEFKKTGSQVVILKSKMDDNYMPDFKLLKENFELVHKLINEGKVLSVATVKNGGIAEAVSKMCFGNKIGFKFSSKEDYFVPMYGTFIMELKDSVDDAHLQLLGQTIEAPEIVLPDNQSLNLERLIKLWTNPLEKVFPTHAAVRAGFHARPGAHGDPIPDILSNKTCTIAAKNKFAKPRVFIPAFPGTNCEYDSAKAFEDAGAIANVDVFTNLKPENIEESIAMFEKSIHNSQIIMFPGGFSSADEPDGSGKFIASVFRNPRLKEAIHKHLYDGGGLILGICNGFQVLVKLGLLPSGDILEMTSEMPTLTFNEIARHQSRMVNTKVVSKLSPWFNKVNLGDEFVVPVSHGEGRFIANEEVLNKLIENGQIATQYVDSNGKATYDIDYNPNGSLYGVEGITSPDGRILGKMAHSERTYKGIMKNIPGNMNQKLFESGVEYFK